MQKVTGMRSGLNPTDAFMDLADGNMPQDISITELLAKKGIDANAPGSAMQLAQLFKGDMDNADPLNKMKALAQGGGAPAAPPGAGPAPGPPAGGPPAAPPVGPELDRLMKRPT
jgi:hypothetical protein